MDDLISKRKLATELRKKQLYKDAIKIYQPLWSSTKDRYDGCGLLHCLRKTENYEDAIGFARELYKMYPDFDWCRSEVIWTLIASKLYPLNENDPLSKVVETAQKILSLKPDDLARKVIVFKVLKLAKMKNDWNMIDSWVTEINPDTLTQESIQISGNRPGWSDQAIWYNYRVRSFIENGKFSEAISIASNLLTKYPMQKKFFLRLIAVANTKLGKLNDAEQIYIELCISKRSDWWLLSEYADVLNNLEKYEDSLKVMQKAALSSSKLDPMVSLFENMGNVYKKMGRTKQAMNHFLLCKYIRERNDWKLPNTLIKSLSESNKLRQEEAYPATLTEVYSICKKEWISSIGQVEDRKSVQKKKAVKKNVVGKLNAINSMRPFCFIVTENGEDIFCLNSNLPDNSNNGDEVVFDAIPSYDRKKQRDSWKAINLRKRK